MRSLVTGGSGFIGTHLCRHLLACGHRVLNLDALTYAAIQHTPPDIRDHPDYAFLKADITDAPAVRQALHDFQPDRIFHLAAETHVDRSITDAAPFLHTNVLGTHTLLQAVSASLKNQKPEIINPHTVTGASSPSPSQGHSVPDPQKLGDLGVLAVQPSFLFIHISTDEVYGHLGPHDPPFTESSPIQPRSPYAASKAAAEHLVRAWQITHGLPAIIVRPSNNFGPCQHDEKLIPTIIRHALAGTPIPIYGDGSNIRDWIHVEDHVRALATIAANGTPGETYNIGANQELTNLQLATLIVKEIEDQRSKIEDHQSPHNPPAPAGHPPTFRPSTFDSHPHQPVADRPPAFGSVESSTKTHPGELGASAVQTSQSKGKEQGASSITSREAHTKNNLGELGVLAVQPSQSPISFTKDRPGHDFRYALDTTKLRTQLGWHPTREFQSALRELIQRMRISTKE